MLNWLCQEICFNKQIIFLTLIGMALLIILIPLFSHHWEHYRKSITGSVLIITISTVCLIFTFL